MLLETLASVVMSLEASDSVNILRESPCVCPTPERLNKVSNLTPSPQAI